MLEGSSSGTLVWREPACATSFPHTEIWPHREDPEIVMHFMHFTSCNDGGIKFQPL